MTPEERAARAEAICRALGRDVEAEGALAGASTAMSTIIRGVDGHFYMVAATLLVSRWEMSAQVKAADETERHQKSTPV